MTPWQSKKRFAVYFWSKKNQLQKPEKIPLEPLDLLAAVGQSCVCVNVSVLVCVAKNDSVV